MNKVLIIIWGLAFIISFTWCLPLTKGSDKTLPAKKNELKQIQKKIEAKKAQIQKVEKTENQVAAELERIEKELYQKAQEVDLYQTQLRQKKEEIDRLNQAITQLKKDLSGEEKLFAERIKILYQLKRLSLAQLIFSSESFSGLIRRYGYLNRLVNHNLTTLSNYSQKLVQLQEEEATLKENERQLEMLTEQNRLAQKKIITYQKEKAKLLARLRSEKELQIKRLEELKQASQRLQSLIEKLEKEKTITSPTNLPSGYPFSLKGKLDYPVKGEIITFFGQGEDPELAAPIFNKGIEISAPVGTPIKAVLAGTVIYSDWFRGYGNIIIIDHGAGLYTIFGHASKLLKKVGESVTPGEAIALVGDTGSFKGPCLYFEIRYHGQPLDPLAWLKK